MDKSTNLKDGTRKDLGNALQLYYQVTNQEGISQSQNIVAQGYNEVAQQGENLANLEHEKEENNNKTGKSFFQKVKENKSMLFIGGAIILMIVSAPFIPRNQEKTGQEDVNKPAPIVETYKYDQNNNTITSDQSTGQKQSGGKESRSNKTGAQIAEEEGKSFEEVTKENVQNETKAAEDKNKVQYEKPAEDPAITGTEKDKQFEDGIRGSDASTETNKDTPASVKEAPKETQPEAPLEKPQEVHSYEDHQNNTQTEPKTDTKVVNDQEWTFDDL